MNHDFKSRTTRDAESSFFVGLQLQVLKELGLRLQSLKITRLRLQKKASILWSHHEETRQLHGERDNARNNARCMQARKTTHGLDGQHQYVDRTPCGRVNQDDREQRQMEKVHPWQGCRVLIFCGTLDSDSGF